MGHTGDIGPRMSELAGIAPKGQSEQTYWLLETGLVRKKCTGAKCAVIVRVGICDLVSNSTWRRYRSTRGGDKWVECTTRCNYTVAVAL